MARRDQPIEAEAILAVREYVVDGARGRRHLRIAVAHPERTIAGRYECRAEVSDEAVCVVRPLNGVDPLEVLMLAFLNIGTELPLFVDATDHVTWLDGRKTGLCFPVLPEYSLNAVIGDARRSDS
jgi:hypothetical protein